MSVDRCMHDAEQASCTFSMDIEIDLEEVSR